MLRHSTSASIRTVTFSRERLILGGSHSPNLNSNHSLVGDLSAILIQNVNPLINFIRVPSKKIALMSEWETKIEAIANSTIPVNVTSLSGVPSWMLVLIKRILEKDRQTNSGGSVAESGSILPRRSGFHPLS